MILYQKVNEYLDQLSNYLKELSKAESDPVREEIEVHLKDKVKALKTRDIPMKKQLKRCLAILKHPILFQKNC